MSTPSITLNSSEPILAVADVSATIRFYRDVLGFQSEWTWGTPPTFGGVRWAGIHVMFGLQPDLARRVEGHQHSFMLDDVDALYELHRARGATIIEPIENKPWGIREYTVRDPNGYHLRFGGQHTHEGRGGQIAMPAHIRIDARMPTVDELAILTGAQRVGNDAERTRIALRNSLFGAVAIDTQNGQTVGCIRVVGDGGTFFYIQDV